MSITLDPSFAELIPLSNELGKALQTLRERTDNFTGTELNHARELALEIANAKDSSGIDDLKERLKTENRERDVSFALLQEPRCLGLLGKDYVMADSYPQLLGSTFAEAWSLVRVGGHQFFPHGPNARNERGTELWNKTLPSKELALSNKGDGRNDFFLASDASKSASWLFNGNLIGKRTIRTGSCAGWGDETRTSPGLSAFVASGRGSLEINARTAFGTDIYRGVTRMLKI